MTYNPVPDMEMGYHLNFRDPDGITLEFSAPNEAMLSAQRLMAAEGLTEADIAAFHLAKRGSRRGAALFIEDSLGAAGCGRKAPA